METLLDMCIISSTSFILPTPSKKKKITAALSPSEAAVPPIFQFVPLVGYISIRQAYFLSTLKSNNSQSYMSSHLCIYMPDNDNVDDNDDVQ